MTTKIQIPPATLVQQTENSCTLHVDIEANLSCFPGHFPQKHILPGVTIIDWVLQYSAQYLGTSLAMAALEVIKFKQVIGLNTQVEFELRYEPEKNKIYFKLHSPQGDHSSGRISLKADSNA